ncbi:AAA family ATPase [Paenibacillus elgii]|uniref:AAA family ATPase n=1 Tax=Paenibacillus elgii TaxID=189691 RepID=UPI00203B78FF|nr:AAA family ATPase [Paenibacillus elgii]MCM3273982.1 ATP-binding protein [Paenibacillus elgii]
MGYRDKVKNNTPKVELHSIDSLIVGGYKTGKTRLWKEVTERHYLNPEEALLIAFEAGYETWELDNIIPIHEEGSDEELWKVWDVFKKEIVPDLVKEAKNGRVVKLIGIDTADRCIDAATAWLLNDRAKKYGVTKIASLQELTEVSNGNENGYTVLYEEMKRPFDSLKNAGYGKVTLAWTKEKETTLYNGLKYNSIELMMHATGKKIFESQASLICCLFNEVVIYDKNGQTVTENAKTKKGREKGSNFHETRTVMVFRPTEYISIAGGRYTELPNDPVEYSAENFLKVFEDAVKGQLKKTRKSLDELKEEQSLERDEKAKEFADTVEAAEIEASKPKAEDYHEKIKEVLNSLSSEVKTNSITPKFREILGVANFLTVTDVEKLEQAYVYAKNLKPENT